MIAAKLANIQAGDFAGNQWGAPRDAGQISQNAAAKALNVGRRTVRRCRSRREGCTLGGAEGAGMNTRHTAALSIIVLMAGAPFASSQNGANAYLQSLSSSARTAMLGKIVGAGCVGSQTFYMGLGTAGLAKDDAFWSVRCQNGRAYVVQAHPDGKSTVLECSVLKDMHAGECFKKLP